MYNDTPKGTNSFGGASFMEQKNISGFVLAGTCAGIVNGLFGAGGGMVLVPLLTKFTNLQENEIFPVSVAVIFPICIVSLCFSWSSGPVTFLQILPYLSGSVIGGITAGMLGKKIPSLWLHRILGLLIIWGGLQYL